MIKWFIQQKYTENWNRKTRTERWISVIVWPKANETQEYKCFRQGRTTGRMNQNQGLKFWILHSDRDHTRSQKKNTAFSQIFKYSHNNT